MNDLTLEIRDKLGWGITHIINDPISCNWVTSFQEPGYSTFTCVTDAEHIPNFAIGSYITRADSDQVHFITDVSISRDISGILYAEVHCKDVIALFDRRVILDQIQHTGTINNFIKKIIQQNITTSDQARNIGVFSTTITDATSLVANVTAQARFDSVLEKIVEILKQYNIGIKARLNTNALDLALVGITIYSYTNQTIGNNQNPVAIFSDDLGNLNAWNFEQNNTEYRNVAVVAGEGEGTDRTVYTAGETASADVDRYELYVDARDLSKTTDDGELTPTQYRDILITRGNETLAETGLIYSANTEVNSTIYTNGIEYGIGSLVSVRTEAFNAKALVTQITEIFDTSGYSIFPTLTITELE